MSAPIHQSIICFVCTVLVQSLKICFEFLPLLCPLWKCGWGNLLSPCQALQFWCCSSEILLPVWADRLPGSITWGPEGLVSVFYRNEKSCYHLLCSQLTLIILVRFVFMSVLPFLMFIFFYLAWTVLDLISGATMQYKVHLEKKNQQHPSKPQRGTTPAPLLTPAILLWETLCCWFPRSQTAFSNVRS